MQTIAIDNFFQLSMSDLSYHDQNWLVLSHECHFSSFVLYFVFSLPATPILLLFNISFKLYPFTFEEYESLLLH
jgi:hypothetical protein